MIRSEFQNIILKSIEHECLDAEKTARYALALWSQNRMDEARVQLTKARQQLRKHLGI